MQVSALAASRPICSNCATTINNAGATPASTLKMEVQRATAVSTYIKIPEVDLRIKRVAN